MEKIFSLVGFVSGMIAIAEFIFRTVSGNAFLSDNVQYIAGGLFIVSFIIIMRNPRYYHDVYKYYSYVTRSPRLAYDVYTKRIIYTYNSRTQLSYEKDMCIKTNVHGLNHFTGKFRWSKPQSLSAFHVTCLTSHKHLSLSRENTWNLYSVEFDPIAKGEKQDINVLISDLQDPNLEAVPFCSASIVEKTKDLYITIVFDEAIKIKSIKYKIFDNASSTNPTIEEKWEKQKEGKCHLSYDVGENRISVHESFPIYGYKYQVEWEFS